MPLAVVSNLLEGQLVDRVLERLSPGLRPSPDLAGLTALYRAWCHRVPFDNLQKRISLESSDALLPGDDPRRFFGDWLEYGVGGTCWAGSNALLALLNSLGFRARRALAVMHLGPREAPNHGTIIVPLDGRSYLVDTSMLHRLPLPLPRPGAPPPASGTFGVNWVDRGRPLVLRWQPLHMLHGCLCSLWRRPASGRRFARENQGTRHKSPFNSSLHARILKADAAIGIAEGHVLRLAADGRWSKTPVTFAESLHFLERELGVSRKLLERLPPDRPHPAPASPGGETPVALPQTGD
jgi:N-hydroxyarylamine O-acetyltransferase